MVEYVLARLGVTQQSQAMLTGAEQDKGSIRRTHYSRRGEAWLDKTQLGKATQDKESLMNHAIAELHVDTQVLERRLTELKIDDFVSYRDLNELIGRDVQNGARHILDSACRRLLTIHGRVMGCVKNSGIMRLNDISIVGTGDGAVRHIHSTTRRAVKKLRAVQDYDALPKPEQSRLNLNRAMIGTIHAATTPCRLLKLEARVGSALAPNAKMLEAIRETM